MSRSIALLVLLAACSATSGDGSPTTLVTTTTTTATTTTEDRFDTGDLGPVEVSTVTVDGGALDVAVASTPESRSQGLRAVDDLGDLDGMLFTWDGDIVTSRFNMRGTLISLDVFFFDARGRFVDGFTMTPCENAPCPSYAASAPYAYALEVPAGTLLDVEAGSSLSIAG